MKTASVRARRLRASIVASALLVATAIFDPGTAAPGPGFINYSLGLAGAGEPSVGVNWETGAVMYQAGTSTLRIDAFDETTKTADWTQVTPLFLVTLDPVLWTDHQTNRTFVGHLYLACSELMFTDNDGDSWITNPVGCSPGSVLDHETVGGGPLPPSLSELPDPLYENAVYYCSHAIAVVGCGASFDGGLTFTPASPIRACSNGHGHIQVAPDGTAYLPHGRCSGQQALITSNNGGLTWSKIFIPDSASSFEGDPAVGVGSEGSLYFGFQQPTETGSVPMIASSHDKGATWTTPIDVGVEFGIKNVQFPTMIAGDDDRAAFAFLGTTSTGDDQATDFQGVWHLYVSTTYDGGATWNTVDVTPSDPVQIGRICMQGIACSGGRNLLDFMGMDIDANGRIIVAYADGCTDACSTVDDSTNSVATIARQSSGIDLIAAR